MHIFPKTSSTAIEGLRLFLINLSYMVIVAAVAGVIFYGVSFVRSSGLLLPFPLGLLSLFLGIPYYVFFFTFGEKLGQHIGGNALIKGILTGILGIIPNAIALNIFVRATHVQILREHHRILLIILLSTSIALPMMCGLGCLNGQQKRKEYKRNSRVKVES